MTLTAAFLLSLAPAALGWWPGPAWAPDGASFLALALLPWMALAGSPRLGMPGARAGEGRAGPAVVLWFALPPVAVGAALDFHSGAGERPIAWVAAFGLASVYALARAADGARVRPAVHGALWLAAVPGLALGALAGVPAGIGRISPLGWAAEQVPGLGAIAFEGAPFGPTAVLLGLLVAARFASEPRA